MYDIIHHLREWIILKLIILEGDVYVVELHENSDTVYEQEVRRQVWLVS